MSTSSLRVAGRPRWEPAVALRASRDFRLIWIGQLTSELGSSMSGIAMPLLALAVTGSKLLAGTLATVTFVAMWLSALPGGYVADRFDGRRVMMMCDLSRAIVAGVVGVSVIAGFVSIWLLVAAAAGLAIVDTLFAPAVSRALRAIVRGEHVVEAVAVSQARAYAADLAGPSLGGILFALARACPFLVDGASFLVSLACTQRLRTRLVPSQPATGPLRFLPAISGGWSHVARDSLLRATTAYATIMNVACSILLFVLILGEGAGAHGAVIVGVTLSLAAGAGLLGSVLAPVVQRRFGLRAVLVAVATARAVLVAAAAVIGGPIVLALAVASVILLRPVMGAAVSAAQMVMVPEEILGRVSGTTSFIATALQPIAPLLAALIIHAFSIRVAMAVLVVAFGGAALLALTAEGLRVRLPGDRPDPAR